MIVKGIHQGESKGPQTAQNQPQPLAFAECLCASYCVPHKPPKGTTVIPILQTVNLREAK